MGAWIEIVELSHKNHFIAVAPLVGAWIEIPRKSETTPNKDVAPLVGAWIEILKPLDTYHCSKGRSSRGSVD